MKEYFIVIVVIVSLGSIILSLAPSTSSARQLKLLCGLCSVGCIVLPIFSLVNNEKADVEDWKKLFEYREAKTEYYDEIYNNTLLGAENKNAEITLKNELIEALKLSNDNFEVHIFTNADSDEIYIEKVELIILPEGLDIDPHAIKEYVYEFMRCEVEVIYEF